MGDATATSRSMLLLRLACVLMFAGRAWEHLFWDATAYRTLLWDEGLMGPPLRAFGISWDAYVSDVRVDAAISRFTQAMGAFYAACAVAAACGWTRLLRLGGASLALLAVLHAKEMSFQLPALLEHSIRVAVPLLLALAIDERISRSRLDLLARAAVSITFISHGLYACGVYPVPGNYVDMTIACLGVGEATARHILVAAGLADAYVGLAIFVPALAPSALRYAVAWGSLTALARIVAGFNADSALSTVSYWMPQVLIRAPHVLLPAVILALSAYKTVPSLRGPAFARIRSRTPQAAPG